MEKLIMIKYGELTTKKDNRKEFIKILMQNIERLIDNKIEIIKDNSRMFIKCNDDIVAKKLNKIFGIHGISIVYKVNNLDEFFPKLSFSKSVYLLKNGISDTIHFVITAKTFLVS